MTRPASEGEGVAPVRVAVIGAGRIAHQHLLFLSGATRFGDVCDRVELLAVCDRSLAAGNFAAERYGGIRNYVDVDEMLESEQPDIVHVLTPPTTHVPIVKRCLAVGVGVICEKPITPNRSDLEDLLHQAASADVRVMESQNYRFNEPIRALDRVVAAGHIGTVHEIDIRINLPVTDSGPAYGVPNLPSVLDLMPAGVIHDFLTHLAYLLLQFAPDVDFQHVGAEWNVHGDNTLFGCDDLDAILIGDGPSGAVHARLRFDARSQPDMFQVLVRGSDGHAEAEIFHPSVQVVRPRAGGSKLSPLVNRVVNGMLSIRSGLGVVGERLAGRSTYDGLHFMLDQTYSAITAGEPLPISEQDMLETSELVDRLLTGRSDG